MTDELTRIAEDSARGSFFLISGTAISTVILAASAILITRLLGPGLYGQYTLALVIPQILYLFTDLGITQGIAKFSAELNVKGENSRLVGIIKYAMILKTLAGIILFAINYFLADLFASVLQRPELSFYIRIASLSILFQVITSTATSAFVGLDKSEYNAIATNIQATAKTIIQITLVLLGFGVAGAVIGHVTSYLVAGAGGTLMLLIILRKKTSKRANLSVSKDLKSLVRYGTPLYFSVLFTGFIPLFQNLMLANFTTDVDVGNYRAAVNFATLLTVFSVPITTALLPAFSKFDSSTGEKIKTFFKFANKYTAMLVMPIVMILIVYSEEVVRIIYGSTFQTAASFLATYLLLYFLVGLGYLSLASFYNGLGETRMTLMMSIITFSVLAVLSPLLTQTYGVQGLIAAFIMASFVGQAFGSYKARRKYHIVFDTPSLLKIYTISIVSIIPSYLLLNLGLLHGMINFLIGALMYLAIYTTLTPLVRIVTPPELQTIIRITQRIRLLAPFAKPILKYQQKLLNSKPRVNTI